jgi:nitroreductase
MAEIGIYETMRTLRAVRRLRPDPIPDDVLHSVLEAATWAPTGGNVQPWRIVAVKEPSLKRPLGKLYYERWIAYSKNYRTAIPAGASPQARARAERTPAAGDYLGAHFGETPVVAVFCFNPKSMAITDAKQERVSVVGGGSVYTAVENLLLACRAEGLGCVLTTLLCECEPEVRKLLAIPDPWYTAAAIPIGYPGGSRARPPDSAPRRATRVPGHVGQANLSKDLDRSIAGEGFEPSTSGL